MSGSSKHGKLSCKVAVLNWMLKDSTSIKITDSNAVKIKSSYIWHTTPDITDVNNTGNFTYSRPNYLAFFIDAS